MLHFFAFLSVLSWDAFVLNSQTFWRKISSPQNMLVHKNDKCQKIALPSPYLQSETRTQITLIVRWAGFSKFWDWFSNNRVTQRKIYLYGNIQAKIWIPTQTKVQTKYKWYKHDLAKHGKFGRVQVRNADDLPDSFNQPYLTFNI